MICLLRLGAMGAGALAIAGWCLLGCTSAAQTPPGGPQPEDRRPLDRVLPAGQEAAIEGYLGDHTTGKDGAAFANPLDQALAVLEARAWPAPPQMALVDGAVAAMCEEFRSGKRIGFRSPPGAIITPVVVLMNRNTGSAAEMLAMALRDNGRATLIGETSAGALFGKDLEELQEGYVILFRTEPTVLSPSGKDYSIRGIPADIECADKREAGRDAILQRALEFIERPVRP